MVNIQKIATIELEEDLEASYKDVDVCKIALLNGITHYSTGEVQKRLDENKGFVTIITAELERRKNANI